MPSSRRSHRIARAPAAWVPERNSKPVWTSSSCFRTHALLRLGASRARFNFYFQEFKAPKRKRKVMSQSNSNPCRPPVPTSADTPSLSELHSSMRCDPIVQLQRSSVNSGLVATVRIGKPIAIRSGTIRIPGPFAVTLETNKSASSAPCVKFMSGVLPGLYQRRRGLQLLQAH